MKCPICKKEVKLGDPEMPFCSERCRLIDLGMWSSEEYRIPGPVADPGAGQTEEADDE
ncbi:DNA gyrase inhibitor YacG [uncultured Paludibaculum sp.]|uniref:DNA gyrase inhibitor YacG n=1 Tax=uncultured Paludibaculum sp. TaxID=1765020 RepID=UPI002AABC713|nr:DNA gyrase inhibitor YacG [uncultured Paludibaculum sp.]